MHTKKKLISFNKKEKSFEINKKKLVQMSRAGFSYDISKKIINLNSKEEFIELERMDIEIIHDYIFGTLTSRGKYTDGSVGIEQ